MTKGDIRDMLFGRLAAAGQFVTEEQVAECVGLQEKYRARGGKVPRLGEILAMKGFMTPDQVRAVLDGQHDRREGLFGEIAVRWRFIPRNVLEDALRFQQEMESSGKHRARVGEILLGRGELQGHQVRAILEAQGKRIVHCSSCAARFNVAHFRAGAAVQCPKCGAETIMGESQRPVNDASPVDVVNTIWLPKEEPEHAEDAPSDTAAARSLAIGGYEIVSRLGSDGTGAVCKARHLGTGKMVALKIMRPGRKVGEDFLERFVEESRQAVLLEHPGIKRVYEVGSDRGRYFLAEEFIEGRSLKRQLEMVGKLTPSEAVETALQLAEALQYGHGRGLVHGDVRPSSVIIDEIGRARLSGLGVAKDAALNLTHLASGPLKVPYYMAPEQALDMANTGQRSDIYSLGAVLYHMVTGRPPYQGQGSLEVLMRLTQEPLIPARQITPEISDDLNSLIAKMLAAEPDERPPDIATVIERLRRAQNRQPVQGADSARPGTARAESVGTRAIVPTRSLPAERPARPARPAAGEKRYARERFGQHGRSSPAVPLMIALVLGGVGAIFLVWYLISHRDQSPAAPPSVPGGDSVIIRTPVGPGPLPEGDPAAKDFNAARDYAENNRGDDEEIALRFKAVAEKHPYSDYAPIARRKSAEHLATAAGSALKRIQDDWEGSGGKARGEFVAAQDAVEQWLAKYSEAGEEALAPGRALKQSLITLRTDFVAAKSVEVGRLVEAGDFAAARAELDTLRAAAGVEGAATIGELGARIEAAEKAWQEAQRLAAEEAERRQREEEENRQRLEKAAVQEAAFDAVRQKVAAELAARRLDKALLALTDGKAELKDNPHAGKLGRMEEALQFYAAFYKNMEAGIAAKKGSDRPTLPFGGKQRPVLSVRGGNVLLEIGVDGAKMELPWRSFDKSEAALLAAGFAEADDDAGLLGYAVFCALIGADGEADAAVAKAEGLGATVDAVKSVLADRLFSVGARQ